MNPLTTETNTLKKTAQMILLTIDKKTHKKRFMLTLVNIDPLVLEKMIFQIRQRRFFNFINVFSLFIYFLSMEKDGTLHLNKLESPSPKK